MTLKDYALRIVELNSSGKLELNDLADAARAAAAAPAVADAVPGGPGIAPMTKPMDATAAARSGPKTIVTAAGAKKKKEGRAAVGLQTSESGKQLAACAKVYKLTPRPGLETTSGWLSGMRCVRPSADRRVQSSTHVRLTV